MEERMKKEQICFILENIFRCDSISCYESTVYGIGKTLFVLEKDGAHYGILVCDRMIQKNSFKDIADYVSEEYITHMIYEMEGE